MEVRTIIHGAVITAAVVALGLTTVSPASAQAPRSDERSGQSALMSAMQRDLNLSAAEATKLAKDQVGVAELSEAMSAKLGDDYAGSWFDRKSGKLVVAVSSADRAAAAKNTKAKAKVVKHSLRQLNTIKSELDSLVQPAKTRAVPSAAEAAQAKAKLSGAVSWSVDVQSNQLVVKVRQGQGSEIASMLAGHGDAVRIEETDLVAQQSSDYLDGGDPFGGCSVGFNVTRGGVGHFLTAGHCGNAGDIAVQAGVTIGPFVESWFPTYDDALVRNDNSAYWVQGPWIFAYTGDPNAIYNVNGYKDSPVGTSVCKSGRTTGVTCGWIRAKNVTVNYTAGPVLGLTQHSACVQGGDSGGSNWSSADSLNYAEGMTSGGVFRKDDSRCLGSIPGAGESISYYYPVAASIAYYGVTLMTA